MPISRIKTDGIQDDAITSPKIGVDVIVADDLAANSVTVSELTNGAVTSAKLDTNIAVSGTLSSGGAMTATGEFKANGGVVFNEDSADLDFRVESNGNANMLFVDGGNDRVGIGVSSNFRGALNVFNGDDFNTASNGNCDNIYLVSDATSGDNVYGASIAFSRVQYPDRRGAAIASVQTGSDEDNVGLVFFTHPSTAAGDPIVEAMRIDSGGNVGIGVSSMTNKLVLPNAAYFAMQDTGGLESLAIRANSSNAMELLTGGGVKMTIDSSGDVGIGVSSPYADLDIAVTAETGTNNLADNGIRLEAAGVSVDSVIPITAGFVSNQDRMRAGIGFICQSKDGVTGYGGDIGFYARGAADGSALTVNDEKVRITDGGYLLVGATTNGGGTGPDGGGHLGLALADSGRFYTCTNSGGNLMEFYVLGTSGSVGNINVTTGGTSFNTSSDYRLKENVSEMTDATTRLKQLNPVRFNFIADADNTVDGFLAHEVQDVVPEAITGTKDELKVWEDGEELPAGVSVGDNKLDENGNTIPVYQGIDQAKLVPLLVRTIQELEARITALESN